MASGPDAGRSVRVGRSDCIVGTRSDADLGLTDKAVSPAHLRLSLEEDGVRVCSLDSANGTWLGTVRLHDVVLSQSTSIRIGDTTLGLSFDGETSRERGAGRFGDAIAESESMRELFTLLERAARSDVSILLEGESGVGKDMLARGIHEASARRTGPFVTLDCGAIPASLIESELFGHEQGAFTGADRSRDGAFAQADGGTLFLDEIGELPIELQPKLLRVLETRQVRPVGGDTPRKIDVRIIAATNRDLTAALAAHTFRVDLFYRLAVLCVAVPPLRDRREDILPLARMFLARTPGFETASLPPELEAMLLSYPWPGNVRQLRNVVRRYALVGASPDDLFEELILRRLPSPSDDLSHLPYDEARSIALERFERAYLPKVLARGGNVVVRAAELAGVRRGSFHRMLRRVREPQGPPAALGSVPDNVVRLR